MFVIRMKRDPRSSGDFENYEERENGERSDGERKARILAREVSVS